ncbi:hypothetical protein FY034_17350 (plasmid) [Trichlorobacter lovleyi]|uniref:hypothetical protein n=1 Tax=Trichlorobacter lovleyi TaxID=313985 RepID=UPI00223FCC0A|nr:hypothetical protein [Trichlorobacter lovleyi]QOX80790.1 hypothetical protein FY034_17350 [Trichlorobacter lovleyi]
MPLIVTGAKVEEFRLKSRIYWLFAWIASAASIVGTGSHFVLFKHPMLPFIGWFTSVVAFIAMLASCQHWWLAFKTELYWPENSKDGSEHLEYLAPSPLQSELSKIIRPLQHITFQSDLDEPREANEARRLFSAKINRRLNLFFYMPLMQAVNIVLLAQLFALQTR